MRDAQKPDHISLNSLVDKLKEGQFVIPDFQREFEWQPWDIRDLMRSIFLDYYIGGLLLWKGDKKNFAALACEPIYGFKGGNGKPAYIVLDGQQRLTAMYYVFTAPDVPLPNRASRAFYFIRVDQFMAENYDEAFYYDWLSSRWRGLLEDRERQYEEHIFPLFIVGQGGWELPNWVQGYEQYWQRKAAAEREAGDEAAAQHAQRLASDAHDFGLYLKEITTEYQIAYVELDKDLPVDKVCDIFTQINSRGVRLDVFDLINALLKPKGLQLKHMWRQAKPRLAAVETNRMDRYILQTMSLLRQGYCSPKYLYYLLPGQAKTVRDSNGKRHKEILIRDAQEFSSLWEQSVAALEKSIKILQHPHEFGAVSSRFMPYVSILPAFAAMQSYIQSLAPERRMDAQRKVKMWYWASVFTNRYSGSVESTSARDFIDFKTWLEDETASPAVLGEFKTRFPTLDLRREVKRGSSIYNGIFNLLILQGAKDWVSGTSPQYDDIDDHHIIPASWDDAANLKDVRIDTILNRTPLTSETNRHVIRDRLPNEYLPEMIAQNGEATVREIFESHLISPDAFDILLRNPFTTDDFEAFIRERERTIKQAIDDLLIKGRLDMQPALRLLDARIEAVELGLRAVISDTLEGDSSRLPGHVSQKIRTRLDPALRRNPAMNDRDYKTLTGQLQFADLRELQDIITSKSLWPQFAPRFRDKGQVNSRFAQLAGLRNALRHNRTVDAITRKDGEAALLWFEKVLGL
ncbi:MAG TPA: DUF262 domain-containing protein [Devosia sp.]|nr:DUF262 domain-containing protein [Devosia sp.]